MGPRYNIEDLPDLGDDDDLAVAPQEPQEPPDVLEERPPTSPPPPPPLPPPPPRCEMTASKLGLPESPAPSLVCDAKTRPLLPSPRYTQVMSQDVIEKGPRREHPVSPYFKRLFTGRIQLIPTPAF